jgi:hypothetical protein
LAPRRTIMMYFMCLDVFLQMFGYQFNNGIPITRWTGDPTDQQLLDLLLLLYQLNDVRDVRHFIAAKSPLHRWGPAIA